MSNSTNRQLLNNKIGLHATKGQCQIDLKVSNFKTYCCFSVLSPGFRQICLMFCFIPVIPVSEKTFPQVYK